MSGETLVHNATYRLFGRDYEILVFCRPNGTHVAKTIFSSEDVIINDGISLEDALERHTRLLPLAVNSRQMLEDFRRRGPA